MKEKKLDIVYKKIVENGVKVKKEKEKWSEKLKKIREE